MALGHNDQTIGRGTKGGLIDCAGPGIYGPPDADGTREETHRELVQAWARKQAHAGHRTTRALADVSAAAAYGLPLFGVPVNKFVAQDFSRAPGSQSTRLVRLTNDRRPVRIVDVDGVAIPVVSPARTVVDIARRHSRIPAIVIGDAALHAHLCTRADLTAELDLARGMAGVGQARAAVELMNGLSESVLESRSRIELYDLGLPIPYLQTQFYFRGNFLARSDFWWPEFQLVGESDGDLKYDAAAASYREKTRTDGLHQGGIRVVRWKRRHANNPAELGTDVRAMMTPPLSPLAPGLVVELAPPCP